MSASQDAMTHSGYISDIVLLDLDKFTSVHVLPGNIIVLEQLLLVLLY